MFYFRHQITKMYLFSLKEVLINTKQNTFLPSEHDYAFQCCMLSMEFYLPLIEYFLNIFYLHKNVDCLKESKEIISCFL